MSSFQQRLTPDMSRLVRWGPAHVPRLGPQPLVCIGLSVAYPRLQVAQFRRLVSTSPWAWPWSPSERTNRNAFPTGLKTLHQPDHGRPVADIVFLHGLMGDREKTWSAPGQEPWPQTLLPREFRDARISAFGYNALVAKWPWGSMVSQNQIDDHASDLLTSLSSHRNKLLTAQKPPIIFVCHSMGGLVCMDALVQSRNHLREDQRDILQATRGIAFMGTPHRGSQLARPAGMLARLAGFLFPTNTDIVRAVQMDSEILERIRREFHNIIKTPKQPIRITCFYEELGSGWFGKRPVDQWSACLDGHHWIGIHSDHTNMTKFATKDDPGFKKLCGEIRYWIKLATAGPSASRDSTANIPHPEEPLPTTKEPKKPKIEAEGINFFSQVRPTAPSIGSKYSQTRVAPLDHGGPKSTQFGVAIICALGVESKAIDALFERRYTRSYGNAELHSNTYSCGTIGRHNVVIVYPSAKSSVPAARAVANCRNAFKNIKLVILAGICGAVPSYEHDGKAHAVAKGDVVVGKFVVPYDQGKETPSGFEVNGRTTYPPHIVSSFLQQIQSGNLSELRQKVSGYTDIPFQATHDFADSSRAHLKGLRQEFPTIHFGGVASGGAVIKLATKRDDLVKKHKVIAFEMEAAGIWDDGLPCMMIKGVSDYADEKKDDDHHKYAAATAAACTKAVLEMWKPLAETNPEEVIESDQPTGHQFIIPYTRNEHLVEREVVMKCLKKKFKPGESKYDRRVALFGSPGVGKTQIALAYARWLKSKNIASIFWVRARNADLFEESFKKIAATYHLTATGDHAPTDVLPLVKNWLESEQSGNWLMVVDSADDAELFYPELHGARNIGRGLKAGRHLDKGGLGQYLPRNCRHGAILITTVDRKAAYSMAPHNATEIEGMNMWDSVKLLRNWLGDDIPGDKETDEKLKKIAESFCNLPFVLEQAAAYMHETGTGIDAFIQRLERTDEEGKKFVERVLRKPIHLASGRDGLPFTQDTVTMYLLTFGRIREQDPFAADLFAFMSLFDREDIPVELLEIYHGRWQVAHGKKTDFLDALGLLKRFSHIKEDIKVDAKGFQHEEYDMGRIHQILDLEWLDDQEGDVGRQFEKEAILALAEALARCKSNPDKYMRYLPHVAAARRLKGTGSLEEKRARAELRDHEASIGELRQREPPSGMVSESAETAVP
ncbi:hypothetical protein B0T14DRAFT_513774 [Immersiella caudata]|uniref:Nucleoside phosphorylase domain-containing protein n=1 Tax=Immersiella caudata TaxID=314043 RepID=A0AA40C2A1_9PEZI|nr:hypothetical protein B0T14DRAFT_513774 [Immersiella caudata]